MAGISAVEVLVELDAKEKSQLLQHGVTEKHIMIYLEKHKQISQVVRDDAQDGVTYFRCRVPWQDTLAEVKNVIFDIREHVRQITKYKK